MSMTFHKGARNRLRLHLILIEKYDGNVFCKIAIGKGAFLINKNFYASQMQNLWTIITVIFVLFINLFEMNSNSFRSGN